MTERTKKTNEKKTVSKPKETGKDIPLVYDVDLDMPLIYSDTFAVQHTENEFVLSFFQTRPPVIMTEAQRDNITEVRAKCVARIVLTPQQMEKNVDALKTNLENWLKRLADKEVKNDTGK